MIKLIKNNLIYFLGIIFLAVPLYPKFPLFFLPGANVAIRLEDFILLLTGVLFVFAYSRDLLTILKNKIILSVSLFFLIGLFSVLSGAFLTQTTVLNLGLLHLFRRIEYISVFVVAMFSIKTEKHVAFLIKILLLIFIYAFFYGVGQKFFELPIITTQNSEYSKGAALMYREGAHLVSTFAGHYDLASVILFLSPMLYILLFADKKLYKKLFGSTPVLAARAFVFFVITAGLWLLVHAASRISIVSYVGGVFLALLIIRKYLYIPLVFLFILVFVNSSSNLLARYTQIFEVVFDKISLQTSVEVYAQEATLRPTPTPTPAPVFEDRSTSIRLAVEWPRAMRSLQKNPIYGTGYSSITLATDNDYLRMLGETGLFGFLSFFLMLSLALISIFKKSLNVKWNSIYGIFLIGVLSGIPGVLLNMMFIDILEASKFAIIFWLMLGSAVAISKNDNV